MIRSVSVDWYGLADAKRVFTPALLLYPERVQANIDVAIGLMNGNPRRWRPHIKTVKCPHIVRMLTDSGVTACKCATTLELRMCCEEGVPDVLFAMPLAGRTAIRVGEIAGQFAGTRVSALVESEDQLAAALGQQLGVFVDINPGMNRTGLLPERIGEIRALVRKAGEQLCGLHYYDGHHASGTLAEREEKAHSGYRTVVELMEALGGKVEELVTSGTPAFPAALTFDGFRDAPFVHRVSPGTILLNDMTSLEQLPGLGFEPAALVAATVVSHPAAGMATCDAGHKSVSVDAGVPNCTALGWPELMPLRPSEEHLPLRAAEGARRPAIGEQLYLLPRHVCPTVNLFDEALAVADGRITGVWRIRARGHEKPASTGSAAGGF